MSGLCVLFQHSKSSKLALNDDFLFLNSNHYSHVSSLTGTAVFHFGSPLYFATLAHFKQQLFASSVSLSQLKTRQLIANKQQKLFVSLENADEKATVETDCDGIAEVIEVGMKLKNESNGLPVEQNDSQSAVVPSEVDGSNVKDGETCDIRYIIVECNAIPFVDTSGCQLLAQLHADYSKHGIRFVLAGCCNDVVSSLQRAQECQRLLENDLYPSVQSAVLSLHCDLC